MRLNLSIIKVVGYCMVLSVAANAIEFFVPTNIDLPCMGCAPEVALGINKAEPLIDTRHTTLETTIKGLYESKIIPLLKEIDKIQDDIMDTVVHIETLEKEANMDDKKLLFLLRKSQQYNALNVGDKK